MITRILRHLKLASVPPPIVPARCRQEIFTFDSAHNLWRELVGDVCAAAVYLRNCLKKRHKQTRYVHDRVCTISLIPQPSPTRHGISWHRSYPRHASAGVHARPHGAPSARRLSTSCGPAASGGFSPTLCRSGQRGIMPCGAGAKSLYGPSYTPRDAQPSAGVVAGRSHPAPASWTVSVCRRLE